MAKAKLAKPRTAWRCQACGHAEARWLGRCPACNEWSTLVEEIEPVVSARGTAVGVGDGKDPIAITACVDDVKDRRSSAIGELDRVLGGGLVAGSFVLLGGDP